MPEKKEVFLFLILLKELQNINNEFPLQYAICLIEISLHEGLSLTELSQKTGMAISTVSRIVSALSKKRQKGSAYSLIEINISPQERRKKEIYLSPAGRRIILSLSDIISKRVSSFDRERLHA